MLKNVYQSEVHKVVIVHATKAYGKVKVKFHILLSSAVDETKWFTHWLLQQCGNHPHYPLSNKLLVWMI